MGINRVDTARALAKAIAFKEAGKERAAELWAIELLRILQLHGILREKVTA